MSASVLALNPGSSSLKAAVRTDHLQLTVLAESLGAASGSLHINDTESPFAGDISDAVDAIGEVMAHRGQGCDIVSHRVVHGGPDHQIPTMIDDALIDALGSCIPLAPLHLPGALASIHQARLRWPAARHVACFDTGFHRDLPLVSRRLAVPSELVHLGVRRYGFHGLSVQSVLHKHPDLGDVVIAHLGSGCSVTAVDRFRRPRHTTMSMTPTAGMLSATRTGDIDPEIVLYLIEQHGYSPGRLRQIFDRESGLAGISGGRHDVRDLLGATDADAELALDVFVRGAAMAIAACATALDGWNALVFTGGVGEHSGELRERITARLRPPPGVRLLTVTADEELMLDLQARQLLQTEPE